MWKKIGDGIVFMLLDFDWGGLMGQVRYPEFINMGPLLRRPAGVGYDVLILPEHGLAMLDTMFP